MLAVHPITTQLLTQFAAAPAHAVLITGSTGIGKASIARHLAEQLLELTPHKLNDYAYVRFITSVDGKAIGIEAVRELEHFLSLKVPGTRTIKRVIIIEDSQLLGIEAQNALLKTLEEPPLDTVIIMTAPSAHKLLPTIRSRVQTIMVIKPAKADLQAVMPSDAFDSMYIISGGLPGLLQAMLTDKDHPLVTAVATARQLLGQSPYQRLLQVDALVKNKRLAEDTLAILQQMAHISLQTAQGPASKRWQGILRSSYEAAAALSANANAKLVLTAVLLDL